jgi:hypothetical protein
VSEIDFVVLCNVMFCYNRAVYVGYKEREVVPVHTIKAYGGSRCTVPLILNLITVW